MDKSELLENVQFVLQFGIIPLLGLLWKMNRQIFELNIMVKEMETMLFERFVTKEDLRFAKEEFSNRATQNKSRRR